MNEFETNVEVKEQSSEQFEEEDLYYITQTKPLRKLIFLVAFTGIMLIMSTYAWFSAQKNVTLSNLTGTVKVVEGLEISLDAKTWSQEVDFSKYTSEQLANLVYAVTSSTADDVNHNIVPTEMLPVSTTGTESTGKTEITMLRGENINSVQLKNVAATSTTTTDGDGNTIETTASANPTIYPGYYAIDFFLKNTSATGTTSNVLQLNNNSAVNVLASGGDASTGIQNTPRVAFALYKSVNETGADLTLGTMSDYDAIVAATMGTNSTIEDVAIWEPNADKHVDYIVTNNNKITWKDADKTGYLSEIDGEGSLTGRFLGTEKIPTYALLESSISSSATNRFTDIYNWSGAATGLTYLDENGNTLTENGYENVQKQITLQTSQNGTTGKVTENYYDLISTNQTSVTGYEGAFYNNNATTVELNKFEIPANEICRIRMYVWLEGQDVDCINYASHGGGIEIDIGLIKDAGESSESTAETTPYLPTGFSSVGGTDLSTGLTIQDSSGNEYVWVEVPKTTTVYPTAGLAITDFSSDEYTKIENDLHTYTSVYRDGKTFSSDIHSGDDSSTGLTSTQYTELKQKMLKSVYQNGGFYVGKYEAGTATARENGEGALTTTVIQANAYTYNYITCAQAQTQASSMASGEYTSSLMFGVQWDLMLKYLETKGTSQSALNSDSTSWGNYSNNSWSITNASAKYYTDWNGWKEGLTGSKPNANTLLSAGADSSFSKMGIYDIAGNVYEWTLEYSSSSIYPCAIRGGCYVYGLGSPASARSEDSTNVVYDYIGFRVSLY